MNEFLYKRFPPDKKYAYKLILRNNHLKLSCQVELSNSSKWSSFVLKTHFCSALQPLTPSGSGLNDGQWHAVRLLAKENFAMLTVDGEEVSAMRSASPLSITTGGTYHLGGKAQPNTLSQFSHNVLLCLQFQLAFCSVHIDPSGNSS